MDAMIWKRMMRLAGLASLLALCGAARPARADNADDAAMREPPAAARWSQRVGADQATRGGTRMGSVGLGSSDTTTNASNANVGNSTGEAATERMPQLGTPARRH